MSLGKTIQSLRERRGLTQLALAQKLGVAQSCVADWEGDKMRPHRKRFPAIARTLRTPVSKLRKIAWGS